MAAVTARWKSSGSEEEGTKWSGITTVIFRREDFGLFRDLLGRITWEVVLENREVQQSWLMIFFPQGSL